MRRTPEDGIMLALQGVARYVGMREKGESMDFWYPREHGAERKILDLSEMISLVTEELHQAEREIAQQRADRHEAPVMQFKECQLELAIEVATKVSGEATIKVFTLGGERTKSNANTITVTFDRLTEYEGKPVPPVVFLTEPEHIEHISEEVLMDALERRRARQRPEQ
jgi:Trypsin-co-occurring domain 2